MSTKNDINSITELLVKSLASEVSDRLLSTVEEYLKDKLASTPKSSKLLYDSDGLAKQLSVSKSTIVKLRKEGMPILRIGESVRFDPEAVMRFINELNHRNNE